MPRCFVVARAISGRPRRRLRGSEVTAARPDVARGCRAMDRCHQRSVWLEWRQSQIEITWVGLIDFSFRRAYERPYEPALRRRKLKSKPDPSSLAGNAPIV